MAENRQLTNAKSAKNDEFYTRQENQKMNHPTETGSAVRQFVEFWTGKEYEKGQTQPFWIGLLRLFGVDNPERGTRINPS